MRSGRTGGTRKMRAVASAWMGAAAAAASVCLPAFARTAAAAGPAVVWQPVWVAGHPAGAVPVVQAGGRTFASVWYVLRLLRNAGVSATWDGRVLRTAGLPVYHAQAATTVDGRVYTQAHTLTVNGSVYVDLDAIAPAFHWSVRYDARAKLITATTSAQPRAAAPSAAFPSVPGTAAPRARTQQTGATVRGRIAGGPAMDVVVAGGSAYADVAVLIQWLARAGYRMVWQHGRWELPVWPEVVADGTLAVDGVRTPSALIRLGGHVFVPMSTLMAATGVAAGVRPDGNVVIDPVVNPGVVGPPAKPAGSFPVSGRVAGVRTPGAKVAFVTADGRLLTVPAAADGRFHTVLPGTRGVLAGVFTPASGWVGTGVPVSPSQGQVTVNPQPALARISGRLVWSGGNAAAVGAAGTWPAGCVLDLRSDLTHAHYTTAVRADGSYTLQVPAGPYELWAVRVHGADVFLGQRIVAGAGANHVGATPVPPAPSGPVYRSAHAVVAAQDSGVSPWDLVSIGSLFERAYADDLAATGIRPALPVTIEVFSGTASYTQHFQDEGYAATDAESYGLSSQAASEGPQTIAVNLDGLDAEWGINVMAHEFAHCLLASVSNRLPDWVNEGVAWELGLAAEADATPNALLWQSLRWSLWSDVIRHARTGDLYALGEAGSLAPRYNVEAQDDYAVYTLVQRFGMVKVLQYVRLVDRAGPTAAFPAVFGESLRAFSQAVNRQLARMAAGSDGAVAVTVRVLPGAVREMFISNPSGQTYWYTGLRPGLYTFVLRANGSVAAPGSLKALPPVTSAADGTWDIGGQMGDMQALVAIARLYGTAYIDSTTVFPPGSDDGITEPATGVPLGLEVVRVQALA
ncbi:hypothetical protein GCM10010885_12940 [Alicyclobacillus cellulosilyticus]|uniref:Copper amine oxidase-like protein n=1 Tax=Alicyclobacillus cellulosilyticus TaxID=1003997 RepID=A0A917K8Y2_9BACL|nr:hypothetical protein [Alicyclobacillus cellulosilyticus]GGJ05249.1 hypothetical protein GCM10010885_12940 [Alicyclobacillus cellulosilyticus]